MKRVIIMGLVLLSAQLMVMAQAPKVTIKWGSGGEMTTFKPTVDMNLFFGDSTIVLGKRKSTGYEIECYGTNLKLIKSAKLQDISGKDTDDDKRFYLSTFEFNGKLYQLNSVNNYKQDKSVPIEAAQLLPKTMKYGTSVELAKQYPMYAMYWKGVNCRFAQSPDKSKVAFIFTENQDNKIVVKVYDASFKELKAHQWTPTVSPSSSMNTIIVEDLLVDNKGNAIWQVEVGTSKEVRKATGHDYLIALISFPIDGDIAVRALETGDNVIKSLRMKVANDGRIVVAGFYSQVDASENISLSTSISVTSSKGTFSTYYDIATNKAEKIFFNPFSEAFRAKFKFSGKRELPEIYLRAVEITDKGDIIILGEQLLNASDLMAGTTGGENRDMIVVKLSPSRTVDYEVNIPKRQEVKMIGLYEVKRTAQNFVMFTGGYHSFVHAIRGDRLRIIYNDDMKNIAIDDPNKLVKCKNIYDTSTIVAEFDLATGKYTRYVLFNGKDELVMMYPLLSRAVSFDKYVFLAANHNGGEMKQYKLGEITLK